MDMDMVSGSAMKKQAVMMPIFRGEDDPCGWILKAEKYFMVCEVEDGYHKVAHAALSMEGKALNWLLLMEAKKPIIGWEMFKNELIKRFRTKDVSSAYQQLLSLRQSKKATVAHYREQFESIIAPIARDISDDKLIRAFINGLNDDVKAQVESSIHQTSDDLVRVMSLAQEIEDKLKISERSKEDEIHSKKEEEQETMMGESLISTSADIISPPASTKNFFKFRGKIGSRDVIVMIDPVGVSPNYISREVVSELEIPVEKSEGFQISGFGGVIELSEVCKRVVLKMHGIEIVERFYLLNLRKIGVHVMLGVEWLRRRGSSCTFHFRTNPKTMTFQWEGRTVQFEMI